jgi:ribonuclease J
MTDKKLNKQGVPEGSRTPQAATSAPDSQNNPRRRRKRPAQKSAVAEVVSKESTPQAPRRKTGSGGGAGTTATADKTAPRQPAKKGASRATDTLKMIPLGGMCEIGKNMFVYEYGKDMIIVDCGLSFPDEAMPGIDIVIPDFTYVLENLDKLRGIFITHGHEDHIGALPWLLRQVKVPVYGSGMSMALVKQKTEDRETGVKGANLVTVKDGDRVRAGVFEVEFIHSNHSIADANLLAIRTPAGTVIHTGDFKIDYTPLDGRTMDLGRIAEIGAEGVLLLVCESTNVERSGSSSSEIKVGESLENLFRQAEGRIFVTTFSSNVFRIQQIFTAAEKQRRKVVLVGRSMLKYYEAASSLGYVTHRPETLIDMNKASSFKPHELLFITTGSQGEPLSALTRMANAEHRQIEIMKGDMVVLSSSAIPGNEKSIYRVINELYRKGARVIYESLSEIHVSGHAYQEELKAIHKLVKPQFFVPCHGEYRHLYRHAQMAIGMGMNQENVHLLNNGDVFEYSKKRNQARVAGAVHTSAVLIDGTGMLGELDRHILRDRLLLAEDGVVTVAMAINKKTGALVGQPDIQARGFLYDSERDRIIKECQHKIRDIVKKAEETGNRVETLLKGDSLNFQLERLLQGRTKRRPVLIISVIDV